MNILNSILFNTLILSFIIHICNASRRDRINSVRSGTEDLPYDNDSYKLKYDTESKGTIPMNLHSSAGYPIHLTQNTSPQFHCSVNLSPAFNVSQNIPIVGRTVQFLKKGVNAKMDTHLVWIMPPVSLIQTDLKLRK